MVIAAKSFLIGDLTGHSFRSRLESGYRLPHKHPGQIPRKIDTDIYCTNASYFDFVGATN